MAFEGFFGRVSSAVDCFHTSLHVVLLFATKASAWWRGATVHAASLFGTNASAWWGCVGGPDSGVLSRTRRSQAPLHNPTRPRLSSQTTRQHGRRSPSTMPRIVLQTTRQRGGMYGCNPLPKGGGQDRDGGRRGASHNTALGPWPLATDRAASSQPQHRKSRQSRKTQ